MTIKPSVELWEKINTAILDENAAVAIVTMLDGMSSILIASGVCDGSEDARIHIAAMLLSPEGAAAGSLADRLPAEIERLADDQRRAAEIRSELH